jgi:hypothetical protein
MSDCRCMHATSGIEAHGTKKLGPTGIDGCAAVNHDGLQEFPVRQRNQTSSLGQLLFWDGADLAAFSIQLEPLYHWQRAKRSFWGRKANFLWEVFRTL